MKLNMRTDYSYVPENGGVVHLLAEAQAPTIETEGRQRPPLNLAIVIDASGSMTGEPLEAAKRASIGVVGALRAEDHLSVVSFASDIIVHVDGQICNENGKGLCVAEIQRLSSRGATDLAGGWRAGARAVAKLMEEIEGTQNHVVLLSDGYANEGVTDPRILAEQAAELRQRNLFTSTVGIGDGYSPVQLQALAEHGGGRMHDAECPEEIIEVVLAELGEMRATAAENMQLRFQTPAGLEVECLGTYPFERRGHEYNLSLGPLISGARRQVLLRLTPPTGHVGQESLLKFNLDYQVPGKSSQTLGEVQTLSLRRETFLMGTLNVRDEEVAADTARIWQSWMVGRAMAANAEGRLEEAETIVRGEMEAFSNYVAQLPEGRRLLNELRRFVREVKHEWSPRASKEVLVHFSKAMRDEADHRSEKRDDWTEFIGRK